MNISKKVATVLDIMTKSATRKWLSSISFYNDGNWNPILVNTNFRLFFKFLEVDANSSIPVICRIDDKEKCIENLRHTKQIIETRRPFNFLENSSIWIRFCENDDTEGQKAALEEFEWFNELGLYGLKPAYEYIDYHLRAQKVNYLRDFGHGVHITPIVYSDEAEFRDFFFDNKSGLTSKFKFLNDRGEGFYTPNVEFRILLVDDKIGKDPKPNCNDCVGCSNINSCKLRIIKELLSGNFILNNKTCKDAFVGKTYWANQVEAKYVGPIKLGMVWEKDEDKLKLRHDFVSSLELKSSGVQIIGVPDLESALALLSCCKFDIFLLDYLLGERRDKDPARTYSTELFEFLSYKFEQDLNPGDSVPVIVKMLKETSGLDDKLMKEFQNSVKLNRGPLDKFWIIPMTSYNSSFISDLQRKHVRLIDHRWNISQGADPINTPWKFLYKINEFVDLQLRLCVFHLSDLLEFLVHNCQDIEDLANRKGANFEFYDFQSFMGAEFVDFMRRYGNRHLIQRDADRDQGDGSAENKSVFATRVWKSFYDNKEYRDELELNRLIQRFLQHVATMHNDRYGRQRLEEAFGQLCFFVETNKKIQDCVNGKTIFANIHDNLKSLKDLMERLTDQSRGSVS